MLFSDMSILGMLGRHTTEMTLIVLLIQARAYSFKALYIFISESGYMPFPSERPISLLRSRDRFADQH